ncbi:MBL fold metallo-hydrolase [Pseudonocardiaceae bacterium YIM PH 21723]|nr:MBL fold metallo-hydrolase [Pseudonocardiaceae bacterium YIM PH 21723]
MTHPAYGELRQVTPTAAVLLQNNPNMMTLDGTNTWILRAGGGSVVVDPGQLGDDHIDRLAALGPVDLVLLTHGHFDHSQAAAEFAQRVQAPVRAQDDQWCVDAEPLTDGERIPVGDLDIEVLLTPGHTSDSLCLRIDGAVLTGDTILGRGTTIVAHPDGRLAPYLDSLHRLAALPEGVIGLPGHGPELPDVAGTARQYLEHRQARLEQVRTALDKIGPTATAREVVELVYADVPEILWPAAELSVHAQLDYLQGR